MAWLEGDWTVFVGVGYVEQDCLVGSGLSRRSR